MKPDRLSSQWSPAAVGGMYRTRPTAEATSMQAMPATPILFIAAAAVLGLLVVVGIVAVVVMSASSRRHDDER